MTHVLPNGLVVLFEGIDGVGKSTQIELCQQSLTQVGWPVQVTRNLGGSPIGEALREVMLAPIARPPLTDLHISMAVLQGLLETVAQLRNDHSLVLIDRSPLSIAAYQIFGSGIDEALGWRYVDEAMEQLKPDLIILYTGDVARAVERARNHSGKADYFESKELDYFERVSNGYQIAAERYGAVVIDANQSIEVVHQATMQVVNKLV